MWWCRGALLAVLLVVATGCGFRPLHGTVAAGRAPDELAQIKIEPIADRVGQELHNHLLDLLTPRGRPERPVYVLRVNLQQTEGQFAIRKTAFATRANLKLQASFQLVSLADGQQLFASTGSMVSGFDILPQDYATLVAREDAASRAARELADDIRTKLAVFFSQRRESLARGSP